MASLTSGVPVFLLAVISTLAGGVSGDGLTLNLVKGETRVAYEQINDDWYLQLFGLRGKVCGQTFTLREARVVCRSLGYTGDSAEIIEGKEPSRDLTVTAFWDLQCAGDESTLNDCTQTALVLSYDRCATKYPLMVTCQETATEKAPVISNGLRDEGYTHPVLLWYKRHKVLTWVFVGVTSFLVLFTCLCVCFCQQTKKGNDSIKGKIHEDREKTCEVFTVCEMPPTYTAAVADAQDNVK